MRLLGPDTAHRPTEFAAATDAAMLRIVLKIRENGGYSWVQCSTCDCDCGWQVPHYAQSVG